jgi:hypothetical protein
MSPRAAALGLALALGAGAASACDPLEVHVAEGVDYVVPGDSPVAFVGLGGKGEGNVASFSGRFVLEGDWEYGYVTDDPSRDAHYGELYLQFDVDATQLRRLPQWKQADGVVRDLWFANEESLVSALVGPGRLEALRRGEIRSVRGHARLVVEGLRLAIDCDQPNYRLTFVAVERSAEAIASRELADVDTSC